jgi:hypothetical protein
VLKKLPFTRARVADNPMAAGLEVGDLLPGQPKSAPDLLCLPRGVETGSNGANAPAKSRLRLWYTTGIFLPRCLQWPLRHSATVARRMANGGGPVLRLLSSKYAIILG